MENTALDNQVQQKEQGRYITQLYHIDLKEQLGEEKMKQIEGMMNDRGFNITIIDLNGKEIPIGVSRNYFLL